jgi:hypothetical protein
MPAAVASLANRSLCWHPVSPLEQPKGGDLSRPAEAPPIPGEGRHHLGTVGGIIPESWAACSGISSVVAEAKHLGEALSHAHPHSTAPTIFKIRARTEVIVMLRVPSWQTRTDGHVGLSTLAGDSP